MPITYRSMREDELPETLKLWDDVFKNAEWNFKAFLDAEENNKLSRTRLAVEDSGRIVAAVHYYVRPTRGADGTPQLMGAVANVATHADARKQGHSGKLIEQAIEEMTKDNCAWSMLFTGVNAHYERYGWKTVETRYRQGTISEKPAATSGNWQIVSSSSAPDDILSAIAEVHSAYNANRPLTHVRSRRYWQIGVKTQLALPGTFIFTARENGATGRVCAYTVIRINPANATMWMREAGYLPGCESAMGELFSAIRGMAAEQHIEKIIAYLPFEPGIDTALPNVLTSIEIGKRYNVMARPLSSNVSQEELEKLFTLPGAHNWTMDDF